MARRRRKKTDEVKPSEPPMSPMIDVIFQLLIFFMLTMNFKKVEGKLLSQLPKDKGLNPTEVTRPELEEVRIIICAGGNWQEHKQNKGKHEKIDKPNIECVVVVDKIVIGNVFMTEKYKDKMAANRAMYQAMGDRVKENHQITPSMKGGRKDASRRPPVILDADSEVPYEHIIGAVNACKERGIDNVEFVGNPRFDKYYGSYQKGQFKRNP